MTIKLKKLFLLTFTIISTIFFNFHHFSNIARAQQEVPTGTFAYMTRYEENNWFFTPEPPFHISSFSGTVEKGIVAFGGFGNKQGAFIKDITNGRWEVIADAPYAVHQCCGDNAFGPIICGGEENRNIAYMRSYSDNIWQEINSAPFLVTDIAGTNEFGPIIVGGPNRLKVAYMRSYSENKWFVIADAPFPVTAITGDNNYGIIVVGGENNRQVAYMRKYDENRWTEVANAPFSVIDIAGNNHTGPVVVGGKDNMQAAYLDDYSENKWHVIKNVLIRVSEISGANDSGILVGKIDQKSRMIVDGRSGSRREQMLKTAVVEFQERGELGMQDAGAIIAEWLTTALNKTGGFEVYERLSLSTLMEEHKLGASGLMDEKTAAEIGRIRGVEAIVTGSVSKLGDVYSVTAKVIDVTTAKIITSSDIKVNDVNAIVSEIDQLAWELAKQ